jgi:hypothetical protein
MKAVCAKCNGTGTELVPGKGARACSCRRKGKVVDLQTYRAARSRQDADRQDADRVERELEGVMAFFAAHSPDFITDAVVDAISEACNHVGMEAPTYEHDAETRATLKILFSKTKMLRLRIEGAPYENNGEGPMAERTPLNAELKAESHAKKWCPLMDSNH